MAVSSSPGGFWRSLRQLPGRTPLRIKLITAVLALVAIALVIISVAGISVLRSYLLGQVDNELQSAALITSAEHTVGQYLNGEGSTTSPIAAVDWVPAGGKVYQVVEPAKATIGPYGTGPQNPPKLISGPQVPDSAQWLAQYANHAVTVRSQADGGYWRVLVLSATGPRGSVIIGINVSTQYKTIARLGVIDLVVSAIVLVGLAVVGIAVIRSSLRPLADIEQTAGAIAAGELSRRIPGHDPRTEVGRLGRSLNAMLSQIETAFRARADSEASARRSEERMRQFVADASHELRTPLTAIRGFAEYYRQRGGVAVGQAENGGGTGLELADLNRIMRRVEQEAARMGVLVEDMLLLARLDQQRPLEHRTVDLLALAADAVQDARVVAPDRSINLTVSAGAALLVLGDETRLRQVIGNLMSNALTHTPPGTPIEVRIRSGSLAEAPPDGHSSPPGAASPTGSRGPQGPPPAAVLEVADYGPGLTAEQAERVFERFYRVDTARTTGGAGLGLAIVAALVAAHGGRVWVESPASGGAVFRVALPLAPEALLPQDPAPEITAADAATDAAPADAQAAAGPAAAAAQAEPDQAGR